MDEKCVIILSESMPVGLKANIASVLSLSLGRNRPDLVGETVTAADGTNIPGITRIPVPILTAPEAALGDLYAQARVMALVVPFTDAALKTKNYDDYRSQLAAQRTEEMVVHGLLLLGARKDVNRIAGRLPLLR